MLKKVVCANGHLCARLTTQNLFRREEDETPPVQAALALSGHLLAIANEVRDSKAPPQGVGARDPCLLRGIVLLSISAAMAYHGTAFLLRSHLPLPLKGAETKPKLRRAWITPRIKCGTSRN